MLTTVAGEFSLLEVSQSSVKNIFMKIIIIMWYRYYNIYYILLLNYLYLW